jgi:hypothetical protein
VPEADVVIAWSFAPVPAAVRSVFQRPTRFIELPTPQGRKYGDQVRGFASPTPLRGILRRYAPDVTPLRAAVLGFSESCAGALALLKSADGARLDAAIAIDGIHTAPEREPSTAALAPWVSFATLAAQAERLCVITHSSIQPPYASTTATAAHIWSIATGSDQQRDFPAVRELEIPSAQVRVGSPPAARPYVVEYPRPALQPPRRLNGLVVLGFDNIDPAGYADHIYQARHVLPAVVARFLAGRWSAVDPRDPEACLIA